MPINAALAADALHNPEVRVVGVVLNRHRGDTERTNPVGLATTCDCPFRRLPSRRSTGGPPTHGWSSRCRRHGQMGENPPL